VKIGGGWARIIGAKVGEKAEELQASQGGKNRVGGKEKRRQPPKKREKK